MELRNTVLYVLIFALGIASTSLIYEVGKVTSETPLSVISSPVQSVTETFAAAVTGKAPERVSPGDHVLENQIKVYSDRVQLNIQDAIWSKFKGTNSMDPFLDEGANGIEIIPKNESEIQIGDIVSYESEDGVIVHRVIEVGNDTDGTYFIVKGDNNPVSDPGKVRFSQIKGILVGIIY